MTTEHLGSEIKNAVTATDADDLYLFYRACRIYGLGKYFEAMKTIMDKYHPLSNNWIGKCDHWQPEPGKHDISAYTCITSHFQNTKLPSEARELIQKMKENIVA